MNKLFKHAFDPFQGKYFAVFLPVKRYSYPQEILLCSKFPLSLLIVRQLNFFELELHRRSSHRRTILSKQVSANSVAPIRKKKILRCFPRRDHPPRESSPVYVGVASPVARIAVHIQQRARRAQ